MRLYWIKKRERTQSATNSRHNGDTHEGASTLHNSLSMAHHQAWVNDKCTGDVLFSNNRNAHSTTSQLLERHVDVSIYNAKYAWPTRLTMEWMQWHCGSNGWIFLKRWSIQRGLVLNISFIHWKNASFGQCFPPLIIPLQSIFPIIAFYHRLFSVRHNLYGQRQTHSDFHAQQLAQLFQQQNKTSKKFRTQYKSTRRDSFLR